MMKKLVLVLVLLQAVLSASAQEQLEQKVRPFVFGGIGMSEFWLNNAHSSDRKLAWQAGFGLEIPFKNSRWGVQPSVLMSEKGARMPYDENDSRKGNVHLVYVETSLDAFYRASLSSSWSYKVAFGPYIGRAAYGHVRYMGHSYDAFATKDVINSYGVAFDFERFDAGLHLQMQMARKKLFFGLNYDAGFVPVHAKIKGQKTPSNYSTNLFVGLYF